MRRAAAGPRSGLAGRSRQERQDSREQARVAWLTAVRDEDALAAGWCARKCETLEGAEDFVYSDGLEAFILIARGQSVKPGAGGLMAAMAQAAIWDMSPFKVAVFETIAAAGRWPQLRLQVVEADVLSIVAVALLARTEEDNKPRHPPAVRALMARLCALSVDLPEAAAAGSVKRAAAFAAEREHLMAVRAFEALVEMVGRHSDPMAATAAANAVAAFAGPTSDGKSRAKLVEVGVVVQLLSRLEGGCAVEADLGGGEDAGPQAADAVVGAVMDAVVAVTNTNDSSGPEGETEEGEEEGSTADNALSAVVGALAAIATLEGEGAAGLLEQLATPVAAQGLRRIVASLDASGRHRQAVESALRCLSSLGQRAGVWPEANQALGADLARLLFFGSEAAGVLLEHLLADRRAAAGLGDLRPLHRALAARLGSSEVAGALQALENTKACGQCGSASERALLLCGGCRQAEYCSQGCQRAAWKEHKVFCKKGQQVAS